MFSIKKLVTFLMVASGVEKKKYPKELTKMFSPVVLFDFTIYREMVNASAGTAAHRAS